MARMTGPGRCRCTSRPGRSPLRDLDLLVDPDELVLAHAAGPYGKAFGGTSSASIAGLRSIEGAISPTMAAWPIAA